MSAQTKLIEELAPGDLVLYPGTEDVCEVSRVLLNDPDDPSTWSPDPGKTPVVQCTWVDPRGSRRSRVFTGPVGSEVTVA